MCIIDGIIIPITTERDPESPLTPTRDAHLDINPGHDPDPDQETVPTHPG